MKKIHSTANKLAAGRRARFAILVASLVAAPFVSAQLQQKTPPSSRSRGTDSANDVVLAREVRHQLQVLPYYSVFDNITFVLNGGKVTLSGQVLRPTMKVNAAESIRSLEGVTGVINQIEVLPESPSDDELRRDVYRAIFEDQILQKYAIQSLPSIRIIVKNGSVALEGFADSASDKNLAGSKAGGVANVSGVKNNLAVRSADANR